MAYRGQIHGKLYYRSELIHKKFQKAVKKTKTKTMLNKAFSTHKKDHEHLLKKHLREETVMINKAKKKLD